MPPRAKSKEPAAASASQREKNLELALAQVRKSHGEGVIRRFGERIDADSVPAISSGSVSLDRALGIWGFPRGRVTEIFGPESSGKTTVALHAVANAQAAGGIAAYIDVEHAMDPKYTKALGVNLDELLISQPDYGEQALDIVETLVRSNAVDIVVVDSVAALVPKAELEGEIGDSHVGLQARLMSQTLRKLTGAISHSKTSAIFINQIREKIGVMFGSPETTPGGRALKFYSSIRLDVRRIGAIKDQGRNVGNRVKARVVKNKCAPPFQEAEFDIMFGEGISLEGDLLDLGVGLKVVERTGAWLSYQGERLGQGRENAKQFLKEHKDVRETLLNEVKAACGAEGATASGDDGDDDPGSDD